MGPGLGSGLREHMSAGLRMQCWKRGGWEKSWEWGENEICGTEQIDKRTSNRTFLVA